MMIGVSKVTKDMIIAREKYNEHIHGLLLVFHNDSRGHRESCRIGAESRGERKSRIIRLERNVSFLNRVGCIACDVLLFLTVRTSKRVHSGRSEADETKAFLRNAAPRRVASRQFD